MEVTDVISTVNALLILASVWQLSAGKLKSGNALGMAVSLTGILLFLLLPVWPLVVLHVVLFSRCSYLLYKLVERKPLKYGYATEFGFVECEVPRYEQ